MFVRVKDTTTGHEFDVPEDDKRIARSLLRIKDDRYPPVRKPRPPKYHVQLAPVTGPGEEKSAVSKGAEK